ncbi:MAG: GGDEF domain-containing protein [Spirochaetaceae bacterium]|jgi:diguanylate cyclase (GGDEF)-like protein|nr:GGDEF domain-containing protein [Spirochaetaceae bacterium]
MLKLPLPLWTEGFSQDDLASCKDSINAYNIQSLSLLSLVTVFLLGACSIVPLVIEKLPYRFMAYLAAALAELVIHGCSRAARRRQCGRGVFYALFTVFFLTLMALGFYTGIVVWRDQHTVMALLFLVYSQSLFVVDFFFSAALNFATAVVFSHFTLRLKPPMIGEIDAFYIWITAILALALNRYLRHVVIKEMISSRRLAAERDRFREESIKDELTGLSNRRDYQNAAKYYISVCQHVHQTVCAIMLDVDFFKNYNDFYGHQKGDEALQAVGKVLKDLVAEEQVFAARVGGEEFIVLWTENRVTEAERVAIKICHLIANLKIPHERSEAAPFLTVSLGVYMLRGGSRETEDDLYRETDNALYAAKAGGRNCIMLRDSADRSLRMIELLPPEENIGRRSY